jgi:hypothetical protein
MPLSLKEKFKAFYNKTQPTAGFYLFKSLKTNYLFLLNSFFNKDSNSSKFIFNEFEAIEIGVP